MYASAFPVIDLAATGDNIRRLRVSRGLSVRQLQSYFGFEEPRAIYKWQKGESLPTVDNLYALGKLLDVPMEQILVPVSYYKNSEQQAAACCSNCFSRRFRLRQSPEVSVAIFSAALVFLRCRSGA